MCLAIKSGQSGKRSFFKPHVDAPRSENVRTTRGLLPNTTRGWGLTHPTPSREEWTFVSAATLGTASLSSVGYGAFFSGIGSNTRLVCR
ncbi:hypothetical protein BC827DRAFT_1245339 [Russula dissimulans]|nr:hypothetical protein BC827DRAFT_1245339 [Russula dissimulans]